MKLYSAPRITRCVGGPKSFQHGIGRRRVLRQGTGSERRMQQAAEDGTRKDGPAGPRCGRVDDFRGWGRSGGETSNGLAAEDWG